MYSLELLWGVFADDHVLTDTNDYTVIVVSDDYDELFAIARDTDFRQWAAGYGCAFIEIWTQSDNVRYMGRV